MSRTSMKLLLVLQLIAVVVGASSNQGMTIDGQLLRADGSAVSGVNVNFVLNLYDTGSNCLLWSEAQSFNMGSNNGLFSLVLGLGTNTAANGISNIKQVFMNSGNLTSLNCATGNSYTPTATDDRKLVVTFTEPGNSAVTLSAISIKSVPFALQADQVAGYSSSNLFKISTAGGSSNTFTAAQHDFLYNFSNSTPTCSSNEFLKYDGTNFICLSPSGGGGGISTLNSLNSSTQSFSNSLTGTTPVFFSSGSTHTLKIPLASASSVTAGLISKTEYDDFSGKLSPSTVFAGDISGTSSAVSVDKIKGTPATISSLTSGNFLKYNGSAWVNSSISASDIASGVIPISSGGTGVSTIAANRILASNGTGSAFQAFSCSVTQVVGFDAMGNASCVTNNSFSGFTNGGNSFTSNAVIGTTDNFGLDIETFGANRISVLAGGNVGIGTSSPVYQLHVASSGGNPVVAIENTTSNSYSELEFIGTGRVYDLGVGNTGEIIYGLANKFYIYDNSAPAVRMVLDSSGNFGFGTTAPNARVDIADASTTTSAIIVPRAANFTGTAVNGMVRYNTASTLFEFRQNGAWVNFTTVSDARLKTNVSQITNGLSLVNKLNPVFYDWDRSNPKAIGFEDKHQVGFIAQEVETVLPEVVNKGEDSYRSVEYGKIVAVVVAGLKELYAKVIALENRLDQVEVDTRIQRLENENQALRARLEAIESTLNKNK